MKTIYFILIVIVLIILRLSYRVNFKKRYSCKYAVVTGATGGIGREMVKQLLQQFNVIAVARNAKELDKMKEEFKKTNNQIIPFIFNFSDDLTSFSPKFDEFLQNSQIQKQDIGICFSNAGYGEIQRFNASSYIQKREFFQVNVDSHIMIADYFIKLFLQRKQRSLLQITSSLSNYLPIPLTSLYHISKAALSTLGTSLYVEYRQKYIDVLTVHPTAVRDTKFFKMNSKQDASKLAGLMEQNWFAVTPQQVVNKIFARAGKVAVTCVGSNTVFAAILTLLGRNVLGYSFSLFSSFADKYQNKIVE